MSNNRRKILAIDPGTRNMGVAFFEGQRLLYRAVKTFPRKRSPHGTLWQGRKTVLRLINDLRPGTLAVEKTFFSNNRNTALLNAFYAEIQAVAKRKGLKVLSYAPNTVKKAVCGNGHAEKREVARKVASQYLELKVYLTQDRAWKERYHQNMFDAVALGMTALGCGT
jgi:crossover junction endodeoxyribonuclease RuvC